MGVRLTEEEIDGYLGEGHTLILATVRKSGEPFMTPLWYVWMDGSFWVGTGGGSAKVRHIRKDPRVCCLVESGVEWVDLQAVIANCDAEIIEDEAEVRRIQATIDAKYARFRLDRSLLPDAMQKHYATGRIALKMTPRPGEIRTWHNRKIRLKEPT